MEEFTIYYGTPEGRDIKIGVDCDYPRRIKRQKIRDAQVLEVHTCVFEVSQREMELQRQYGVEVDTTPYHVTYFKNKSTQQRTKISAANTGKVASEETKAKLRAAKKGKPGNALGHKQSKETKAKMRVPKPRVQCPHCERTIGTNNIKRHIAARH